MKLIEYLENIKTSIIQNQKRKKSTPKVEIKDFSLKANIGHWLGVIPLNKVNNYLELTDKEIEEIELRFGELLKEIGISEDETCILSGYNKRNFLFNCLLKKKGTSLRIFLNYGDGIDFSPEMVVINGEVTNNYDYYNNLEPKLYFRRRTIRNSNNIYFRDFYSYFANIALTSENSYLLKIHVNRPDGLQSEIPNGFILNNESELETYLLNLKKDANAIDVFDNFCEICFKDEPIEEIKKQRITLEFTSYSDSNHPYICKITLIDGRIQIFIDDNGQILTFSSNYANRKELKKN